MPGGMVLSNLLKDSKEISEAREEQERSKVNSKR